MNVVMFYYHQNDQLIKRQSCVQCSRRLMFAGFNAHARAEASLVLASVAGLRLPEYFGNGSHLTHPPPPHYPPLNSTHTLSETGN
jgi:hypothetical protein